MSLLFLVSLLLIKMITIVDSAPKLVRIYNDPLKTGGQNIKLKPIYNDPGFSDEYLSNDGLIPNFRRKDILIPNIRRNDGLPGYAGYIFDETICKHVNGRILCGYNRNKGDNNEFISIDMGDGCRSRGDRIECGYGNIPTDTKLKLANLRAIIMMPTRTPTYKRETSSNTNLKETMIVKPSIHSVASEDAAIPMSPTESIKPATLILPTTYPVKLQENINLPLVRLDSSDNIDAKLVILPTKFTTSDMSKSEKLGKSLFATTLLSTPTTQVNNNNNYKDQADASTRANRRMVDEIKIPTKISTPNLTETNKSIAYKIKKNKAKKLIYEQVLRSPKDTEMITTVTNNNPNIIKLSTSTVTEKSLKNLTEALKRNSLSTSEDADLKTQLTHVSVEIRANNPTLTSPGLVNGPQPLKNLLEYAKTDSTSLLNHNTASTSFSKPYAQLETTEKTIKILREDKTKVKTECVEQKERIVCYDYKAI